MSSPQAVDDYAPRPERKGELIAEAMEIMGNDLLADVDTSEAEVDREYAAVKAYLKNIREQIVARKAEAIANATAFSLWCSDRRNSSAALHEPPKYPHPETPEPEPIAEPLPQDIYGVPRRDEARRPYIRRVSDPAPGFLLEPPEDYPALQRQLEQPSNPWLRWPVVSTHLVAIAFAVVVSAALAFMPR